MTSARRPVQHHAPEARLFVAVPVPGDVCTAIGQIVDRVKVRLADAERAAVASGGPPGGRVRWVRMDALHVTLRFLGGTAEDRIEDIGRAVDAAAWAAAPFEVEIDGAGAFPAPGRPRALWLGIVGGAERLATLAGGLEDALVETGWPREARPFRAHLTVARTDGVRFGPLAASELSAAADSLDVRFQADRLVLFRSHLGGGPARYEAVHEAFLGGPIAGRAVAG
jgi:2'-5' RNA ligase